MQTNLGRLEVKVYKEESRVNSKFLNAEEYSEENHYDNPAPIQPRTKSHNERSIELSEPPRPPQNHMLKNRNVTMGCAAQIVIIISGHLSSNESVLAK